VEAIVGIAIAVGAAVIVGVLGWIARPVFQRPQRALARALAGAPIAVEVVTLVDEMSDVPALEGPTSYAFSSFDPTRAKDIPIGVTAWQRWAYERGGEDVATSVIQVTLQGTSDDPISIEAPVLEPHATTDRPETKRFGPGGLGGGGVMPRHFTFHLDGERVERTFEEEVSRPAAFMLAAGETERLVIQVEIHDDLRHEWGVRLPYVRRGSRQHLDIRRRDGSLFVTVGSRGLEHWFEEGRWFKARRRS
jgi:hypothetical protein